MALRPTEGKLVLTEGRFSLRLFLAFATIALAFIASTVYSNWHSLAIEAETHELLEDALPSISHLTNAVDALRDLEAATDDYPDQPAERQPGAKANILALWRTVDAELLAYLELPFYPGERELYADVPASLRDLDASIQHLFAQVDAGDTARARITADQEVRATASHSARLLRGVASLNADHAAASSMRIQAARRRFVTAALVLDAVTVALTIAVSVWLWRIFRSYSRLQAAHAELVEQRADELELFGRRVAHDLLSPLSSLTFCLSAFKPVSEGDPKLESALARARQCVLRAQGLVENVFDFARSGGAPSPDGRADVREVVEQVVDEARAVDPSERVEIEVLSVPDCSVQCTHGVLASILGNLLRNAVKYMRDSAVRRISLRFAETATAVRFEVEDTGPGVPPELNESLFEPYVRGEGVTQPGLGLGLATVRRFCEAHGGTVGFRSASGKGSVFHFTLPKAAAASPKSLPSPSAKLLREKAS